MTLSSLIFLNTEDRITGTNSNATFFLNQIQSSNILNYSLAFENIEIINNVTPINATRANDTIYLQENNDTGTNYLATLNYTDYTGTSFATEVQTKLNAASGNGYTYTVTFDAASRKLTISEAGNNPFRIVNGERSAHRELGYDVSITDFQVASYTLPATIDISGTKFVDIVSNIGNVNISSSTTSNIIYRVPIAASYGDINFFQASDNDPVYISNDNLSEFTLFLRDDRGKEYDLPFNSPVSYTLRLVA
jgi:hypothetical protein